MATFKKPNGIFIAGSIKRTLESKRLAFLFMGGALFLGGLVAARARAANIFPKAIKRAWSIVREAITNGDSGIREQVVQGLEFVDDELSTKALLSALDDDSEY